MADDIINQLTTACVCGPLDADGACLLCCARTAIERGWAEASLKGYRLDDALDEIVRLRAAGDALVEAHIDDLCDCDQPECVAIRAAHEGWQEVRRG